METATQGLALPELRAQALAALCCPDIERKRELASALHAHGARPSRPRAAPR